MEVLLQETHRVLTTVLQHLLSCQKAKANELGLTPLATIAANAGAGVDPSVMGIGPVQAVKNVLARANMDLAEIDLIEANEAFAAQSIAVDKELEFDHEKLNVNGGAIALGHPIGASGARILVTLLYEMKRQRCKNRTRNTLYRWRPRCCNDCKTSLIERG